MTTSAQAIRVNRLDLDDDELRFVSVLVSNVLRMESSSTLEEKIEVAKRQGDYLSRAVTEFVERNGPIAINRLSSKIMMLRGGATADTSDRVLMLPLSADEVELLDPHVELILAVEGCGTVGDQMRVLSTRAKNLFDSRKQFVASHGVIAIADLLSRIRQLRGVHT